MEVWIEFDFLNIVILNEWVIKMIGLDKGW